MYQAHPTPGNYNCLSCWSVFAQHDVLGRGEVGEVSAVGKTWREDSQGRGKDSFPRGWWLGKVLQSFPVNRWTHSNPCQLSLMMAWVDQTISLEILEGQVVRKAIKQYPDPLLAMPRGWEQVLWRLWLRAVVPEPVIRLQGIASITSPWGQVGKDSLIAPW